MPWQIRHKLPLSNKSIREAFSRLISDRKLYKNYCFCFFIDGLDEYEGTHQEDAKFLVDLLCSWTNLTPATVKICVSSREDNVFMNAFSAEQRIRLHDLTKSDIMRYVLDNLRHMDREEDRLTLSKAIVENAQGVFVWVALVVKRIREQIENGANLVTLEREIYSLPKQLNSLFEHILNSLVDSDLKEAYQTFAVVFELKRRDHYNTFNLSLLSYSFLDDYNQNHTFALRQDLHRQSVDQDARALRIELAPKRLNGCCRGLLEVRRGSEDDIIVITHRSVSEFLSSRTQRNQMQRYLDGFDAIDAISQLTLAELWSRDAGQIELLRSFDRIALLLVPWRIEAKFDEPPYSFLVSLALAWQRHQDDGNLDCLGDSLTVLELRSTALVHVDVISSQEEKEHRQGYRVLRHPIYSAALHGSYEFVKWELERNPAGIPFFTPLRLLYCILINPSPGCITPQSLHDMMDCLHTLGIRPETASSLRLSSFHFVTINTKLQPITIVGDENAELTLWHYILLRCYRFESYKFTEDLRGLGYIVEKFLEYGADPYFHISVTSSPNWRVKLVVRVGGELQGYCLEYDFPPPPPNGRDKCPVPCECENMSLTELVERWGFENKARVLELIKKNTLMLEGADELKVAPLPGDESSVGNQSESVEMVGPTAEENFKALPTGPTTEDTELHLNPGLKRGSLAAVEIKKRLSIRAGISVGVLVLSEYQISTSGFQ
jgi:hypothetical protein